MQQRLEQHGMQRCFSNPANGGKKPHLGIQPPWLLRLQCIQGVHITCALFVYGSDRSGGRKRDERGASRIQRRWPVFLQLVDGLEWCMLLLVGAKQHSLFSLGWRCYRSCIPGSRWYWLKTRTRMQ
jgi:hypothetical protein